MRVVVAMSGGVDSSAAAALLKEQGHEVIGITLRVWSYEGAAKCGSCCSPDDINDARSVANALNIPFYVANAEEIFKERVVKPFVSSYLNGRTPIPCVSCNQDVKFNFLLQRARSLGARLATGHYARVIQRDGRYQLLRGKDAAKDQSYFLFTLGQDELKDIEFPIGDLTKAEVRAIAERHNLPVSRKPESMEICFVPDGDYARFVEKLAGPQPSGPIVNREGEVIGEHKGLHHYTVGQRKGIGVAYPLPLYVQKLDSEKNAVVVGPAEETLRDSCRVMRPHWVHSQPSPEELLHVKIRHKHSGSLGRVVADEDGRLRVQFEAPTRAVAPGQAAVLYREEEVVGGGWIA